MRFRRRGETPRSIQRRRSLNEDEYLVTPRDKDNAEERPGVHHSEKRGSEEDRNSQPKTGGGEESGKIHNSQPKTGGRDESEEMMIAEVDQVKGSWGAGIRTKIRVTISREGPMKKKRDDDGSQIEKHYTNSEWSRGPRVPRPEGIIRSHASSSKESCAVRPSPFTPISYRTDESVTENPRSPTESLTDGDKKDQIEPSGMGNSESQKISPYRREDRPNHSANNMEEESLDGGSDSSSRSHTVNKREREDQHPSPGKSNDAVHHEGNAGEPSQLSDASPQKQQSISSPVKDDVEIPQEKRQAECPSEKSDTTSRMRKPVVPHDEDIDGRRSMPSTIGAANAPRQQAHSEGGNTRGALPKTQSPGNTSKETDGPETIRVNISSEEGPRAAKTERQNDESACMADSISEDREEQVQFHCMAQSRTRSAPERRRRRRRIRHIHRQISLPGRNRDDEVPVRGHPTRNVSIN